MFIAIWILIDKVWDSISDLSFLAYVLPIFFFYYFSLNVTLTFLATFFYFVTQSPVLGVFLSRLSL